MRTAVGATDVGAADRVDAPTADGSRSCRRGPPDRLTGYQLNDGVWVVFVESEDRPAVSTASTAPPP